MKNKYTKEQIDYAEEKTNELLGSNSNLTYNRTCVYEFYLKAKYHNDMRLKNEK